MRFVLDASVALKTVLNEVDSAAAFRLHNDAKKQIHQLIAPDTLPVEVAHALTRAERKGLILQGDGSKLFAFFLRDCPILFDYGDLIDRAMELSSQARLGLFDCLYVALAEREHCPVVTADQRIVTLFPDDAVSLASL
jgi:predicted nucleic acid-binding protein